MADERTLEGDSDSVFCLSKTTHVSGRWLTLTENTVLQLLRKVAQYFNSYKKWHSISTLTKSSSVFHLLQKVAQYFNSYKKWHNISTVTKTVFPLLGKVAHYFNSYKKWHSISTLTKSGTLFQLFRKVALWSFLVNSYKNRSKSLLQHSWEFFLKYIKLRMLRIVHIRTSYSRFEATKKKLRTTQIVRRWV